MGTIFNIQRYCLHDGDGIRTTVFLKGCPLRCVWCHNPEGLSPQMNISFNSEKCTLCGRCISGCVGRRIEDGKLIIERDKCIRCSKCVSICLSSANDTFGRSASADEVMVEVVRDKLYYKTSNGGMTLSGGEPSMQADFALELIQKAKEEGIGTSIETCGFGERGFYEKASDLGATFLFDVKCIDSDRHKELTGVGNERILSNLLYLFSVGADVIIRMPMIPSLNDRPCDIENICRFLKEHEGKYRYAEIMPYHSFGAAKAERIGREALFVCSDASEADIDRWCKAFEDMGVDVKVSR